MMVTKWPNLSGYWIPKIGVPPNHPCSWISLKNHPFWGYPHFRKPPTFWSMASWLIFTHMLVSPRRKHQPIMIKMCLGWDEKDITITYHGWYDTQYHSNTISHTQMGRIVRIVSFWDVKWFPHVAGMMFIIPLWKDWKHKGQPSTLW